MVATAPTATMEEVLWFYGQLKGGHAPGGLQQAEGLYVPSTVEPTHEAVDALPTVQAPTSPLEGGWIDGKATHYGESYNGQPLGCGTGAYQSSNPSIVAVAPTRDREWPCGTVLEVCGLAQCVHVTRHDSCPGCGHNHIDLSESGILAACGVIATCEVTIRVLEVP